MLLTTRDLVVATTMAAHSVQVDALNDQEGSELLLKAVGLLEPSSSDAETSLKISHFFGGLPLAITQVGGFIAQRKTPLQDFVPLYERYSSRIEARQVPGSDYEHTLSTVWDVSFEKLTETSTSLLNLLSFFDPDRISEEILLEGSQGLDHPLSFLSDRLD